MRYKFKKLKSYFEKLAPCGIVNAQRRIAVDIGTSSVKLAIVTREFESFTLLRFADYEYDGDGLSSVLNKLVEENELKGESVNISLSGPGVVTRYLNFPQMAPAEAKNAMEFEAKEYLPFPLEEVILDSWVLKDKLQENKMLLLLAAVKKSYLAQRLQLITESSLVPAIVDIDTICIANFYSAINRLLNKQTAVAGQAACAMVNLGYSYTNISIIENGLLLFSRDIPLAGRHILNKYLELQTLTRGDLYAALKDARTADEILKSCESLLNNLSNELRLSIDYYENQSGLAIEKIYLTGGMSNLAGLDKALNILLGTAVEVFQYSHVLIFGQDVNPQDFKNKAGIFPVAIGLALRR